MFCAQYQTELYLKQIFIISYLNIVFFILFGFLFKPDYIILMLPHCFNILYQNPSVYQHQSSISCYSPSFKILFCYCFFSPTPHGVKLASRLEFVGNCTSVDFHHRALVCPSYTTKGQARLPSVTLAFRVSKHSLLNFLIRSKRNSL